MTTLMRNGRDRRSENPFWAIARLERVLVFGTDQRITSGPAATVAASRRRQAFTRKQAAYMAAPERFADKSDSSCTAGAVHTWPLATDYVLTADGRFWGEADIDEFRRAPHLLRMTLSDTSRPPITALREGHPPPALATSRKLSQSWIVTLVNHPARDVAGGFLGPASSPSSPRPSLQYFSRHPAAPYQSV